MRTTPIVTIPFGDGHTAAINNGGSVNIRLVDDDDHITMSHTIRVDDFARIASEVFSCIATDITNNDEERSDANTAAYHIHNVEQSWRRRYPWSM